jgi:phosphocarrier protein HPr
LTLERRITIINKLGLHARAASKFVAVTNRYTSRIDVGNGGKVVNGKSIMSIMLLAASQGTELILQLDGDDEEEALQAIVRLIEEKFGESE